MMSAHLFFDLFRLNFTFFDFFRCYFIDLILNSFAKLSEDIKNSTFQPLEEVPLVRLEVCRQKQGLEGGREFGCNFGCQS